MKFKFGRPLTCKFTGMGGRTKELSCIIDPHFRYCAINKIDAVSLGYGQLGYKPEDWANFKKNEAPIVLSLRGLERTILFKMNEVSVGSFVAKDVDTVVFSLNIPPLVPIDAILGQSFLENRKITFDFEDHSMLLN